MNQIYEMYFKQIYGFVFFFFQIILIVFLILKKPKAYEGMKPLSNAAVKDLKKEHLKKVTQKKSALEELLNIILNKSSSDWEVLGVTAAANVDEIKKAYRERVKDFHPDHIVASQLKKEEAQTALRRIIQAKEHLLKKLSGHSGY